ncbi:MAG TPA: hypothetical protein VG148_06615 [Pyrinomonadaceae bacterium]|nr:hypothetical protein [Pyrinomonadaceae bacterium]
MSHALFLILLCLALALSPPGRAAGRQDYAARADQIEAALKARDPKRKLKERIDGGHYVAQEWKVRGRKVLVNINEYASEGEAVRALEIAGRSVAAGTVERLEGLGDDAFYSGALRGGHTSIVMRKGRTTVSLRGPLYKVVRKFAGDIAEELARQ